MFETAGVARTERSIINWCQPNRTGVARLDCYFDPNDRKYYVTLQSVELAIAEERAKAAKARPENSEPVGTIPKPPESRPGGAGPFSNLEESGQVKALEQEVMDLKIVNRGKDYFIDQLKTERESLLGQLIGATHKVGELETRLLQLGAPSVANVKTEPASMPGSEGRPSALS